MKRSITYLVMLLTLAACTGTKSDVTAVLDRAEAIMEEYPDSAYTLLYNIDSVTVSGLSRAESARYYLLLGTAMNKTDRPMAFDS
ncbi:MAG: lipoprotein, partial [Bacteroidaceae bacterium]|nr:lipoprotein [Bacteroidaceae bacterium]